MKGTAEEDIFFELLFCFLNVFCFVSCLCNVICFETPHNFTSVFFCEHPQSQLEYVKFAIFWCFDGMRDY